MKKDQPIWSSDWTSSEGGLFTYMFRDPADCTEPLNACLPNACLLSEGAAKGVFLDYNRAPDDDVKFVYVLRDDPG